MAMRISKRGVIGLLTPIALCTGLLGCGREAPRGSRVQTAHEHAVAAGRPVHWSYQENDGPGHWAELSEAYELCASGRAQSPIDLRGASTPDTKARFVLDYQPARLVAAHHEHVVDVLDNGHTIQFTYDEGSTLSEGGTDFELVQFHFHAPSEHWVNGRSYAMELHLVHKSEDGQLAVMGVLVEEGEHNPAFEVLWENLPTRPGETRHAEGVAVDVDELLPSNRSHYRYTGSLTTPPCSEGVRWFVMENTIELSQAQIEAFTTILDDNNRPTQPLHGRRVALVR